MKDTPDNLDMWLEAGCAAIELAAHALHGFSAQMRETIGTEERGRETKIAADAQLHQQIQQQLASTKLPVFSEEGDTDMPIAPEWCWVLDPLDGSVNFQRGFSLYGISVALCYGTTPQSGFIYDAHLQQPFQGGMASTRLTSQALKASSTTQLDRAIVATGIPSRMKLNHEAAERFELIYRSFHKVRMLGSAVQSLMHLATGKLDAYFEHDIMLWDVAAGLAIAESAGCRWISLQGSRPLSRTILATTPALFEELRDSLLPHHFAAITKEQSA